MVCGLCDDVHRLRLREPHEVGRGDHRHVPGRAGADPYALVDEHLAVDEHAIDLRQRKRRDRAGCEAGQRLHL
jgi:hypothetical protein